MSESIPFLKVDYKVENYGIIWPVQMKFFSAHLSSHCLGAFVALPRENHRYHDEIQNAQ